MNLPKLRHELRNKAHRIAQLYENTDGPVPIAKSEAADLSELVCVLARILEGKTIGRAFGAPGDWGYGTPIGDALAAAPDPVAHDRKDGQRFCSCWFCLNTGPKGECENCGLPPSPERLAGAAKREPAGFCVWCSQPYFEGDKTYAPPATREVHCSRKCADEHDANL